MESDFLLSLSISRTTSKGSIPSLSTKFTIVKRRRPKKGVLPPKLRTVKMYTLV